MAGRERSRPVSDNREYMDASIDYELNELLETAESAATAAGRLVRELISKPLQLKSKGFRDIVTNADISAQKRVTDIIRARFPEHGFLTEETDDDLPTAGSIIWIVDPIDGTTNYSRQIPEYCVSVAAAIHEDSAGQILAGAVYDPAREELFSAARGLGSRLNGLTINASSLDEIASSVVGLDWSRSREERMQTLQSLGGIAHRVTTIRAIGAAALALAWVAAGRLDAYYNLNLQAWDVAAGALLVSEAGGCLTNFDGKPWRWQRHQGTCLASNGWIHEAFRTLVN